jgi:beta-galactosidase
VTQILADGKDICHVEYRVVDDKGVLVPDAGHEVTFEVQGPGMILGIGNADLNNPDSYKDLVHKAFRGRGQAILQSGRNTGQVRMTARTQGLESASIEIRIDPIGG